MRLPEAGFSLSPAGLVRRPQAGVNQLKKIRIGIKKIKDPSSCIGGLYSAE
jgi:hypothetical protein